VHLRDPRGTLALVTSPEAFFALVERHVTPPMLDAGYTRIGEFDQVADGREQGPLLAVRRRWLTPGRWFSGSFPLRAAGPRGRELVVGYEGYDEEGDDERWVRYRPDCHELDLTDWRGELLGRADRGPWVDRDVPTTEELERRLRVLGDAIASSR
jgi:hypothetical protein